MATDTGKLTALEAAILERICEGHAELREWLASAVVERREYTGVGSYTYFANDAQGEHLVIGLDRMIRIPGVVHGLGASLCCRGGLPAFLEVIALGDQRWDGSEEGFVIAVD